MVSHDTAVLLQSAITNNIKYTKMKQLYKLLIVAMTVLFVGCSSDSLSVEYDDWTITVQPNLPQTSSGLYILELDTTKLQTVHVLRGQLLQNNTSPNRPRKLSWESSHEWFIGDTLGYIVKRVINDEGRWVPLDTLVVDFRFDDPVPTINPTSISKADGTFAQTMAPIFSMKGDTLTIKCDGRFDGIYDSYQFKILLQ